MKNNLGVYKIQNNISGKVYSGSQKHEVCPMPYALCPMPIAGHTSPLRERLYVGSSCDLKSRWSSHKYLLNSGQHHSHLLQKDWDSFGKSAFSFEVLVHLDDRQDLIEVEQKFINSLSAWADGYNICSIAGSVTRSETPHNNRMNIRVEYRELEILEAYCKVVGRTKTDVIRELIRSLASKKPS